MADPSMKWPENAPGKFYVDENCICTKYCTAVAPEHFKLSDDGYAYVYRQPASADEEARCRDAMRGCPPQAIGDNGGTENV